MTQLALVLVVLAAATAFGLWRQRTDGRMRSVSSGGIADAVADHPGPAPHPGRDPVPDRAADRLASEDLGAPLGERATLVQFSSAFCQPCRVARAVLGDVAGMVPGVAHVELDAEAHLDLVRRVDVTRTPTVLVLDAAGRIRRRATGAPRRADVIGALGEIV